MMGDAPPRKVFFLLNVPPGGGGGNVGPSLHLLTLRILLTYCYTHEQVEWAYHLFRSSVLDISYRKIATQSVSLKSAHKLLSDLTMFDPAGSLEGADPRGWEDALGLVVSALRHWQDDEEEGEIILFLLTPTLPPPSHRVRMVERLIKRLKLVVVDISPLIGGPPIDSGECGPAFLEKSTGTAAAASVSLVPTDFLLSDISHLCFRQAFRWYLSGRPRVSHTISDISGGSLAGYHLDLTPTSPSDDDSSTAPFTSLRQIPSTASPVLTHENCHFVTLQPRDGDVTPSFGDVTGKSLLQTETDEWYQLEMLSERVGALMKCESPPRADLLDTVEVKEEEGHCSPVDGIPSFHAVEPVHCELYNEIKSALSEDLELSTDQEEQALLAEIAEFHSIDQSSKASSVAKLDPIPEVKEEELAEQAPAATGTTTEEAMKEGEERSVQRSFLVALVRRLQRDLREELASPGQLKEQWSDHPGELVRAHKIQVALHVAWFCDFTERESEEGARERAFEGVLALLRSLSFLTSPNEMFAFLLDQVVEDFHEDCPGLLREIYEEGFLTDPPDILIRSDCDSFSLTNSVLSMKVGPAPLYCEDTTSSQSSAAGGTLPSSQRPRSWMDSSAGGAAFSIAVPRKGRKSKRHRVLSITPDRIAARVCSEKQGVRHLSEETPPTDEKQSSKRRKLTRKNSVMDTPLKKQVKNSSGAGKVVEVTPQKTSPISRVVHESPIRGNASAFFGSQAQPSSLQSFIVKDGFKTPSRPSPRARRTGTPSGADEGGADASSPGTPSRRAHNHASLVRKVYNSPMRMLFSSPGKTTSNGAAGGAGGGDYIAKLKSPCRMEKENQPFFPTGSSSSSMGDRSGGGGVALERRSSFAERISHAIELTRSSAPENEAAAEPVVEGGTYNIETAGGFMKLLEDSNFNVGGEEEGDGKGRDSDAESDVSSVSSSYRSILKSPFLRRKRRTERRVSFSLDAPVDSSQSDTEGSDHITTLIDLVDGSIKQDEERAEGVNRGS